MINVSTFSSYFLAESNVLKSSLLFLAWVTMLSDFQARAQIYAFEDKLALAEGYWVSCQILRQKD